MSELPTLEEIFDSLRLDDVDGIAPKRGIPRHGISPPPGVILNAANNGFIRNAADDGYIRSAGG